MKINQHVFISSVLVFIAFTHVSNLFSFENAVNVDRSPGLDNKDSRYMTDSPNVSSDNVPVRLVYSGTNVTVDRLRLDNDFETEKDIDVKVDVINNGTLDIANIVVRFYLEHPDSGGEQIGADNLIPSLTSGTQVTVSQSWHGFSGAATLYCQVDAQGTISEQDETDNWDSLEISSINNVPWTSQEKNGYCNYAALTMVMNYWGADVNMYHIMEFAGVPCSFMCIDDKLINFPGVSLSQSHKDYLFLGELFNCHCDLVNHNSIKSFFDFLREKLKNGIPVITSVDPFYLPLPDYDNIRASNTHGAHAVVLVGISESCVLINDPATGTVDTALGSPELRASNIVVERENFINALQYSNSQFLTLAYQPTSEIPDAGDIYYSALERNLYKLSGLETVYDQEMINGIQPGWKLYYGLPALKEFNKDLTVSRFLNIYQNVLEENGRNMTAAIGQLVNATGGLFQTAISWHAGHEFYKHWDHPLAPQVSQLYQQMVFKGDTLAINYANLLNGIIASNGQVDHVDECIDGMSAILDDIIYLMENVQDKLQQITNTSWVTDDGPVCMAQSFHLYQNYPNPFNPDTMIRFDLDKDSVCELNIFNIVGQKVRSLFHGYMTQGNHELSWNGRNDNGQPLTSGVYYCQLSVNGARTSKKMQLIR